MWFFNPKKIVSDVADQATAGVQQAVGGSGNFFVNLITSPFRAVANFAKGVWGSLWNGALYTAGIAGISAIIPEFRRFAAGPP